MICHPSFLPIFSRAEYSQISTKILPITTCRAVYIAKINKFLKLFLLYFFCNTYICSCEKRFLDLFWRFSYRFVFVVLTHYKTWLCGKMRRCLIVFKISLTVPFFHFQYFLTLILPAQVRPDSHFFIGKMLQKGWSKVLLYKFKFLHTDLFQNLIFWKNMIFSCLKTLFQIHSKTVS
jgi:hypothetical protein